MSERRLEVADVLRQHEQEFLQRWGHALSAQQLRTFRDICACRTAVRGAHVEECDNCSQQIIGLGWKLIQDYDTTVVPA